MEEFERFTAQTRLKMVTELLRAHDFGWALIAAIEECTDKAEARAVLMGPSFGFEALEAEHVWTAPSDSERGEESSPWPRSVTS